MTSELRERFSTPFFPQRRCGSTAIGLQLVRAIYVKGEIYESKPSGN